MNWIAISGSWRYYSKELEKDVRSKVNEILDSGDSIVTGGALGVDYFATDEVLKRNFATSRIKIFIPTSLPNFIKHYKKRASEGVITESQANRIVTQLLTIKKLYPKSLIENLEYSNVTKEAYYKRNQFIIDASNELIAFHVNETQGTQDAIDRASTQGKKVWTCNYQIEEAA